MTGRASGISASALHARTHKRTTRNCARYTELYFYVSLALSDTLRLELLHSIQLLSSRMAVGWVASGLMRRQSKGKRSTSARQRPARHRSSCVSSHHETKDFLFSSPFSYFFLYFFLRFLYFLFSLFSLLTVRSDLSVAQQALTGIIKESTGFSCSSPLFLSDIGTVFKPAKAGQSWTNW